MTRILLLFFLLFIYSCKWEKSKNPNRNQEQKIEIQGHRGSRGTMPENSIEGFIAAINDSVDVLEMDVVISRDKKVVISHEPFMASEFILLPDGDTISSIEEKDLNLYKMNYDSIMKFETGIKNHPDFPQQKKLSTYKPLLSEAIDSIENYLKENSLKQVGYNIEIKSEESEYGNTQPEPGEFVNLVMNVIQNKPIENRYSIQSFDPNILEVLHKKHPEVPLVYLVYKPGISQNLSKLTFTPDIFSPNYKLVTNEEYVDSIRAKKMKLIPWTINDTTEIKRLIALGVDGIISDYPKRVYNLLN